MNFDAPKTEDVGLQLESLEDEAKRLNVDQKPAVVSEPAVDVKNLQALAMEATAQETADAEQASALAARIKKGEIGAIQKGEVVSQIVVESQDVQKETQTEVPNFQGKEDGFRGEAEMALALGDTAGFQTAYITMSENKIARLEDTIARLDRDFQKGSFQERWKTSGDAEHVKGIYEYQRKSAQDQIVDIKEFSLKTVREDPESIILRDGYDKNTNKMGLVSRLVQEVETYVEASKKTDQPLEVAYPNATKKLEGAITMALQHKDTEVLRALPGIAQRLPLSLEMKKQIADLGA